MKNKLGLYAKYCKVTGELIVTEIKKASQIYSSNKNSTTFFWDFITDNVNDMYDYDVSLIPLLSPNFNETHMFEASSDHFECEMCNEYFKKENMYHISDGNDTTCSVCNDCY